MRPKIRCRKRPGIFSVTSSGADALIASGQASHGDAHLGVKFAARYKVIAENGTTSINQGKLSVSNADAVVIYVTAASDYNRESCYKPFTHNLDAVCQRAESAAMQKGYAKIKADSIASHQELFQRVSLKLGKPSKKDTLKRIRHIYNCAFELNNTSDHLYIIKVGNNASFVMEMKKEGITCGIHYGCAHMKTLYKSPLSFPNSEDASKHVVSIPFHEALSNSDVAHIIEKVGRHVQKTQ